MAAAAGGGGTFISVSEMPCMSSDVMNDPAAKALRGRESGCKRMYSILLFV